MQRELGLDRVVKLASNEGPWGPFAAALEAMERCAPSLNRYPDGGAFYLRRALAERHGVGVENVITAAGADALVGHLSLATLDPGDEIVTAWPSFISYVLDAVKLGAVPRKVAAPRRPLRPRRAARRRRAADEARLHRDPEQPDRHDDDAGRARRLLRPRARARAHRRSTRRTSSTSTSPDYPDGIAEYAKAGRSVLVLRTFSKIYGLAGLRIGYGVGPPDVIQAIGKTRRAVRRQHAGAGGGAREPRRARGARAAPAADRRRARDARAHAARARARAGRAGGRELPLRRGRRRRGAALRGAAAPGRRSSGRWPRSGLPARSGSRSARRRRTSSSPPRSPPCERPRPSRPEPSAILSASRAPGRPRLTHANDAEERHGPRCGRERKREAGPPARRALADHDLPPAAAAPAHALGGLPHVDRLAPRRAARVRGLGRRRPLSVSAARSPQDLQAHTPDVKIAAKRLDVALPGQPATALVVGYDRRAGEGKGTKSRSDTIMLVRADPKTDSISLLSLPARPLRRDRLSGPARRFSARINDAYSECGTKGTLETVRKLTGLPVNYLITVNFRGFRQLVDALGGIWIDVDRRYFNDRERPLRLRDDQPLPGLPEARRLPGARLRPLPAHRLRPLPARAPAALRARVQGPDQVERRARSTCRA